jgi:beta-mannanase
MIDRAELIISMQKGVSKLYELQNNKKYEDAIKIAHRLVNDAMAIEVDCLREIKKQWTS